MNKKNIGILFRGGLFGFLLFAAVGFSSCQNNVKDHHSMDSDTGIVEKADTVAKKYCFRAISGNENRDTLTISMYIANNRITGEMTDAIFEKDARRGRLSGRLSGKNITATWIYMQEGIMDTLALEFLLQKDGILMAPLVYNPKTGRQEADSSISPWINIPGSACL